VDHSSRSGPFLFAAAVISVVSIAVFRLPEEFITQLRSGRPFSAAQAGWLYRLLALAAVAQAAFVGFSVLRVERVEAAQKKDPKLRALTRAQMARSLARNGALIPLLTIVYGLSATALTGERGGYWLFLLLALLQLAWYFREVGQIERWLYSRPPDVAAAPLSGTEANIAEPS
jgi:hypothetical protein